MLNIIINGRFRVMEDVISGLTQGKKYCSHEILEFYMYEKNQMLMSL